MYHTTEALYTMQYNIHICSMVFCKPQYSYGLISYMYYHSPTMEYMIFQNLSIYFWLFPVSAMHSEALFWGVYNLIKAYPVVFSSYVP